MAQHRLLLYSPTGTYITVLRFKTIDCSLVERGVGVLSATLFPEYRDDLFQRHSRIAYLRGSDRIGIESDKLIGDTMWLLVQRQRTLNSQGEHAIRLLCHHPNALLASRVVAYDEGTAEANKGDIGSDTMYDYIDENFVSATDTDRNLSTSHFVLDPRPSPTFGASIDTAGSYQRVSDILSSIVQASAAQGAYIGYEVYVQQPPGPFRVRFYSGQRGTDRGFSSSAPLILSPWSVNMERVTVGEDWSSCASVVYAGGEGKGDERVVGTASDSVLIGQSPFGRVEQFESFNTNDPAIVSSGAYNVLRDERPHRFFDASVASNPDSAAIYDHDFTWGDICGARFAAPQLDESGVTTAWEEYQFDVRVNPVHIQVAKQIDQGGQETDVERIEITLQSVEST